jgi:tRNA threonylcarbamoyladenosine biosynthesis protein TsaB
MYSLFLDHSFPREVLALFENGRVIHEVLLERSVGDHPCFFWQRMLEETGCSLEEVDFFVCGVGPGSYTGMRGAAATVKTVALVQKKPIVAVSSLALLCPDKDGVYLLIKDAKIAGFYAQTVCIQGEVLSLGFPEVLARETVTEHANKGLSLVCDEADAAAMKVGAFPIRLQSTRIAQMAFESFFKNVVYGPENLPLSYLRKTQAEIEIQLPTTKKSLFCGNKN